MNTPCEQKEPIATIEEKVSQLEDRADTVDETLHEHREQIIALTASGESRNATLKHITDQMGNLNTAVTAIQATINQIVGGIKVLNIVIGLSVALFAAAFGFVCEQFFQHIAKG